MLGPRSLKHVDQSNVSNASRIRKTKLDTLKLPYTDDKDDTDEDFSPTEESGYGDEVSHSEERSQVQEEASAGLTRTRPGRKSQGHKQASLVTASTTSTSLPDDADNDADDDDVYPVAQHNQPLGSLDNEQRAAPGMQQVGTSAAQESAPPPTQMEGVALSNAQLPSPIAAQLLADETPSQQEDLPEAHKQKDKPSKGNQVHSGSQYAPMVTTAQLVGAAQGQNQLGPESTDTQASPQRLTRSSAQKEGNVNAYSSPGRPLTRSQSSDKRNSPAKVSNRFKSRPRDQQHNTISSSARTTRGVLSPSHGTEKAGTSTVPAPASSLAGSPNRMAQLNMLTESQLQHIAHPAAKPTYNENLQSGGQARPEGGSPKIEAAASLQPGREEPSSQCENVSAQHFVASVAAKVEQLRLWLRYKSQLVRVVAEAVVDVMRVPKDGEVYRHLGAPVLLICSDATIAAQFSRTIRYGCLRHDGEFLALHGKGPSGCSSETLQEEHLPQKGQKSVHHVLPVVMLQACEAGRPQAGDMVVENVDACLEQDGADEHHAVRWVSCEEDEESLLLDNIAQQPGQFVGKRSRQLDSGHMESFVPAGEGVSLSPEKKRARSDLEAIFQRYPNLSELKKPEYAENLEEMCTMWYGSPAMREYGQMAWFVLAYFVTGYPIEAFRFEKPLTAYE